MGLIDRLQLFKKMKGKSRKEVIGALIKDCGLTQAGANTYYQLIKTKG
jgi:hypothetical protein